LRGEADAPDKLDGAEPLYTLKCPLAEKEALRPADREIAMFVPKARGAPQDGIKVRLEKVGEQTRTSVVRYNLTQKARSHRRQPTKLVAARTDKRCGNLRTDRVPGARQPFQQFAGSSERERCLLYAPSFHLREQLSCADQVASLL